MNFKKTQLVEEVMSFIRNNKMFFNKNFSVTNLQVINNFSDAQNFAWSQARIIGSKEAVIHVLK